MLQELFDSLSSGPLLDPEAMRGDTLKGHGGGLSGVLWLYSHDKRFVFKQLRRNERRRLGRMLDSLADYHRGVPSPSGASYLPTLCALIRVEGVGDFLPMHNIFWEGQMEAFDFKGSSTRARLPSSLAAGGQEKRTKGLLWFLAPWSPAAAAAAAAAPPPPRPSNPLNNALPHAVGRRAQQSPQPPLMELDFCAACRERHTTKDQQAPHRKLLLGPEPRAHFIAALRRDTSFLAARGHMDYSMLVAVHRGRRGRWGGVSGGGEGGGGTSDVGDANVAEGESYEFSLIDFLTTYDVRKQLDAAARVYVFGEDRAGISSLDPQQYADRMVSFFEIHTE